MGFQFLKQSLCSFSLRTGSKIIAWISLLLSLTLLISFCAIEYTVRMGRVPLKPDEYPIIKAASEPIILLFIVGYAVAVFLSILLLVGIYVEQPFCMVPWMIVFFVIVIMQLIGVVEMIIHGNMSSKVFQMIGSFLISTYLLLVICSYNSELRQKDRLTRTGYNAM